MSKMTAKRRVRDQRWRRKVRRRRRLAGAAIVLLPALWIVLTDVLRRYDHLLSFDRLHVLGYWGTVAASATFWAVLLYNAARRRGWIRQLAAGLFVTLYTLAVGVQGGVFALFNVYLSHDGQIYARSVPWALLGYLPLARLGVLVQMLSAFTLAMACLVLGRRLLRPRGLLRAINVTLLPVVLVGMSFVPASYRMWQSTVPDVIYFHGLASFAKERLGLTQHAPDLRVQRRDPEPVPEMRAKPAVSERNVLFILQESLRFDVCCNAYDPESSCATPFSNRAAPRRFPLNQMRANASTTAISISNLWSGVPSTENMETLHSVPLLWEFAKAANYQTAYWTSQHPMFGSARLYVQDLPLDHQAYATQLDRKAHFDAGADDALLSDWVIRVWDDLKEPFFGVVHYSNVHFPYVYDEKHAPFQPSERTKDADKNEHFLNYYRNVVYLSDMAVGRLIEHVRKTESGKRTVIVYTADHGESFREHWQLGHTSSLYDEEIKVPAWIDAPTGTLSEAEAESLRGAADQFVWHYDVAPTILDLLGLWDSPNMDRFRARMIGHPITRPSRTTGPVPLSNCSWLWECGFRNWGMMQGRMKLEAREWDNEFHCFDLLADPHEQRNLGEDGCGSLADHARRWFGPMPFQEWPKAKQVLWGHGLLAASGDDAESSSD